MIQAGRFEIGGDAVFPDSDLAVRRYLVHFNDSSSIVELCFDILPPRDHLHRTIVTEAQKNARVQQNFRFPPASVLSIPLPHSSEPRKTCQLFSTILPA